MNEYIYLCSVFLGSFEEVRSEGKWNSAMKCELFPIFCFDELFLSPSMCFNLSLPSAEILSILAQAEMAASLSPVPLHNLIPYTTQVYQRTDG